MYMFNIHNINHDNENNLKELFRFINKIPPHNKFNIPIDM